MFTHNFFFKLATSSGGAHTASIDATGEGELNLDITVGATATNQQILGANLDVSQVKSMALLGKQDLTLYTNHVSGSSPDNTFTVKANVPYTFIRAAAPGNVWKDTAGATVSTDITSLYVSSAADVEHELNLHVILDATP